MVSTLTRKFTLAPTPLTITKMKPVIQEERTGCAIASSAAITGVSYTEAKKIANSLGIYADDSNLWSDTKHIRILLAKL